MGYYERQPSLHLDGSRIFQSSEDRAHEANVAGLISERWGCNVRSFGALAPVDWYAERHGRLIGVLELKSRDHPFAEYPTVLLNVRKWLALTLARVGLGVPAIYVVRFHDGVWWMPVSEIDASRHRVQGCARVVKSENDIEPVILIPSDKFKPITPLEEAEA